MVSIASFASSSSELHSYDKLGNRIENTLPEQSMQNYHEVGDDGYWMANKKFSNTARSRDEDINQQASTGECDASIPTVDQPIIPSVPSPENVEAPLPPAPHSSTATIAATTTLAPSTLDASLGNVVVVEAPVILHNALGNIVTKYPRMMSSVSTVLITVGSIILFPGVTSCATGTILAHPAVTVAGGVSVVIGKWLRGAVHTAIASNDAQADPGVEADV